MCQLTTLIAVEDPLSDEVIRKVLHQMRPDLSDFRTLGLYGAGHLKNKAKELNRVARKIPVILLTDQDSPKNCPPTLISSWLGTTPRRGLVFRIAVMEIESWVLAHRSECARLLSTPTNKIPQDTDRLLNPKQHLINLARKSRSRSIREDLVPRDGSTSSIGPGYNMRLRQFVRDTWDPKIASDHSPSLKRAVDAIARM